MASLLAAFSIALLINLLLLARITVGQVTANGGAPTVDLGYVKYQGYENSTAGIYYFRGMRFAQAPVGDLRWRAPLPIESDPQWTGQTLNATEEGAICVQGFPEYFGTAGQNTLPASEDCLFADVLVPTNPASSNLPVIVQIHGGGYTEGYNGYLSAGDALVNRSNGNVIYVEIQYRLGLYGFVGGSQIALNGDLNAGLLDQRAGLEWVQRHISAFGGDPAKVMITGASAGGGSVMYQMIANGGSDKQPPFRAVFSQSPWWQPLLNASSQDQQFNLVLSLANCQSLACLRGLSEAQLKSVSDQSYLSGYLQPGYAYGTFYYGPVVDGKFVRQLPGAEFKAGNFYDVPLVVEHAPYEGYLFTNTSWTTQAQTVTDAMSLFQQDNPPFLSRLFQLYPASDFNSTVYQRAQWFGDAIVSCPSYYMASGAVAYNRNSSAVYKMIFAAGSELHVASVPFVYSNITNQWPSANNVTLAEIFTDYYLSFARALDPNVYKNPAAPVWPTYESGGPDLPGEMVGFTINHVTYTTIEQITDIDANPGCDFFAGQGIAVAN